jgi:hypothetical protein
MFLLSSADALMIATALTTVLALELAGEAVPAVGAMESETIVSFVISLGFEWPTSSTFDALDIRIVAATASAAFRPILLSLVGGTLGFGTVFATSTGFTDSRGVGSNSVCSTDRAESRAGRVPIGSAEGGATCFSVSLFNSATTSSEALSALRSVFSTMSVAGLTCLTGVIAGGAAAMIGPVGSGVGAGT